MRKLIIAGFTAGLMALAVAPAFAGTASTASGTSGDCGAAGVNQSWSYQATDANGNPTGPAYSGVQVCTSAGSLTAGQSSASQTSGFIVADGASSNPAPAGGYIGVGNVDPAAAAGPGGVGVVASSCGNYTPGAAPAANPGPPQTSC